MSYIRALFGAISACTLAWGGFILCVWTLVQAWNQTRNSSAWQLLDATNTKAIFQVGMGANLIGITMLLAFSSQRWFRGRWEHYILTLIALILIILDIIGTSVINFVLT